MDTSINIALSGLNAASLRLSNSANNIANQNTLGCKPTDVVQDSLQGGAQGGGVRAKLVERSPATVTLVDPNNPDETLQTPNVSLEEEVVQQQFAAYNFQGSLKVLKAADQMLGSLLDISA